MRQRVPWSYNARCEEFVAVCAVAIVGTHQTVVVPSRGTRAAQPEELLTVDSHQAKDNLVCQN